MALLPAVALRPGGGRPVPARSCAMTLTLFSDYTLRVLMFAAARRPDQFSIDEVADAFSLSRHHLAKVVHHLARRGDLESRRGRGGGVVLARDPGAIGIGDVVRASETGAALVECFDRARNQCILAGSCRLQSVLHEASTAFYTVLDKYTLADLTEGAHGQRLRQALGLGPATAATVAGSSQAGQD